MHDYRVYCQPVEREPTEILLTGDEAHHLISVNRAQIGHTIVAFDGVGNEWVCELADGKKAEARLKVRFHQRIKPLPYQISLGQALPKGTSMDAIVRKATEIGVSHIIPLESERTEVHLDSERQERKIEKWQAAAIEAAKQCGNAYLPAVTGVKKAAAFMDTASGYDLKLIASLSPGSQSLRVALADFRQTNNRLPSKVLWLVGPEGDFSQAEMNAAKNAGFVSITLGPLVLRCETAAVYALSILSYELQNP